MRVNLDVEQMRACMSVWREALHLYQDGDTEGDLRAISLRVIATVEATVTGWLDLLRLCSADAPDGRELQQVTEEVVRFGAWLAEARTTTQEVAPRDGEARAPRLLNA